MTLFRRFLVLCALAFWQGGFAFYGAVVVPTGQRVLGSHFAQGLITQQVTTVLEWAGFVAVCLVVWDSYGSRMRLPISGALGATVGTQILLHHSMNPLVEVHGERVLDGFFGLHRAYLLVGAAQWALAIAWLALALREWASSRELFRAEPLGSAGGGTWLKPPSTAR